MQRVRSEGWGCWLARAERTCRKMACLLAVSLAVIGAAAAAVLPPIPQNFHAVVRTALLDGFFSPYPSFEEVYQDVTNNRALLVLNTTDKSRMLLVVAPKGATPGTKEATEMTLFDVQGGGSCGYEVNDWPCVQPRIGISQCTTDFGYPDFNKVGPWQIPTIAPNQYLGKDVIKINGRNITADKWTDNTDSNSYSDVRTYWVNSSNPSIPLRFQHVHPHNPHAFPGDDWTYQIDYLKVELGVPPDSVFTPPENWLNRCVDRNAGLKTSLPGRQDGYLYTHPGQPGNFSISLRTLPASKLPVVINITFCNSSDHSQGCVDDETCFTCAKLSPTKLTFTQENWDKPQVVTAVFDHVGVGQYKFGVSNNYPSNNHYSSDEMQFSLFACDPGHNVPCTLPPN